MEFFPFIWKGSISRYKSGYPMYPNGVACTLVRFIGIPSTVFVVGPIINAQQETSNAT